MTIKELNRNSIIQNLISHSFNGTHAAKLLHLSIRQVKRLKARVKERGPRALIHAGRGKPGNRRIPDEEREKITGIIKKHYSDFKPTFTAEKLSENYDIKRDPKTIRKIMIEEDLWKPRRKKQREYHAWRQRKACYGEMLQFDGSYYHWIEDRGPEWCLLAAIDDATGIPIKAEFDFNEGVSPVFKFWKEYVREHGKPHSIYLDKFSTYKMSQKVAVENHETQTQFQRAMGQLGIEPITAHSPQAKGRVERLFNTLQDRLVKEMRLAGIKTITQANIFLKDIFLPKYKAKYSVEPASKVNLHQPLSQKERNKLDSIFSKQSTRTVRNDFTVSFNNQWHQLTKDQSATIYKRDTIMVEEWLDGSIHFTVRGKYLNSKVITERPQKMEKENWVIPAKKPAYVPAINHPWRSKFILQV
ncbi:MAG: ISNCY family transposase [Nanoarchaeota archaeon]|nr:ISNCY family transposase [Nanoarchaeota archaeon]